MPYLFPCETIYCLCVAGHCKIVEMTLHHRPEPFTKCWYRLMPAADDLFSHFFELCPETLGDCLATDGETIALPGPAADVREPEKVKRFRLPLSPFGTVCFRKSSEFDQSGLFPVDFQSELGKSFPHFFKESFRLAPILKPHDEIIGVANDDHFTVSLPSFATDLPTGQEHNAGRCC